MDFISIKEYLIRKEIRFRESNSELITHCIFHDCDTDSTQNEGHLFFSTDPDKHGQYHCKKCDARGNIVTLAKH
jgi:hypothetical protein